MRQHAPHLPLYLARSDRVRQTSIFQEIYTSFQEDSRFAIIDLSLLTHRDAGGLLILGKVCAERGLLCP